MKRTFFTSASLVFVIGLSACGRDAPAPFAGPPAQAPRTVRLVTTTSVRDSGLLDAILPAYEKDTGGHVDVVAVGSGAAFKLAADGNADLLLVHDRKGEEGFIAAGDGRERRDFAWNSFEIVGPPEDPAHVKGAATGAEALAKIATTGAGFVSRGDNSGTHRREKKLWETAGGRPKWPGFLETGQGMGATLIVADQKAAYTLTDSGTRLSFQSKLKLAPFLADVPDLRNEYAVVLIDVKKHPKIAERDATRLADWLVSKETAARIDAFKVGGVTLFHTSRAER